MQPEPMSTSVRATWLLLDRQSNVMAREKKRGKKPIHTVEILYLPDAKRTTTRKCYAHIGKHTVVIMEITMKYAG